MPIFLLTMWKNPLVRYLALAAIVAALLLGLRAHFINQGKLEGKQEASDQFSQQLKAQHDADLKQLQDHLKDDNTKDLAINAALEKNAQALTQANQALADLAAKRNQIGNSVAALQDSELHPHILASLGLRKPGDDTPGYTPAEERKIALDVDEFPVLAAQNDQLSGKVETLNQRVDQLNQKVGVAEDKVGALTSYVGKLEGNYATLWNAFPRKGPRTWYTFFLGRGKPPQMPVPSLDAIKGAK